MARIEQIESELKENPRKWLVTGVAGFIGSSLLETLLDLNQFVVGLDSFETGYAHNLDDVKSIVGAEKWKGFDFIEGDIRDLDCCRKACSGVDYVLHEAALGSVPRSIDDPILTNQANVDGFVHMLVAAMEARVRTFVFASSSAVYGDSPGLPKVEDVIGASLSPYAASKLINEIYAGVFSKVYEFRWIGLRYFNVFGRRQDPQGAYAAVIPRWVDTFLKMERPVINGDGETSRDFCYIRDVVQANILAALSENDEALNRVYNIAFGDRTTLNELFGLIRNSLSVRIPEIANVEAEYGPFRQGDVRHSLADTSRAAQLLGFAPAYKVGEGIEETIEWYIRDAKEKSS